MRAALLWTSLVLGGLVWSGSVRAEGQAPPRTLAVLPSTDTSEYNLGPALQTALASLFQQTQLFNVQLAAYAVGGFTQPEVLKAFQNVPTELLAFAYLERERISIFLFDAKRQREFIVVAQGLIDPALGNAVTPEVIEYKFRVGLNELLNAYSQSQFQPLPGAQVDKVLAQVQPDDPTRRAEESRALFRELAAMEERRYYFGASVGMVRLSGDTALGTGGSSSTVNFGGFLGARVEDRIKVELGIDVFNYALMNLQGRYILPIAEKYLTLNATLGLGMVLGNVAPPRDNAPSFNGGQFVIGPGISFDVPLLGANIRGELRFLFGGGTIVLGTYGITYSI